MLPSGWRTITLLNPVVYLISGFRWSFYEIADVSVGLSVGITLLFLAVCMVAVWWIFKTGYRLKKLTRSVISGGASKTRTRNLNKTYR